MAYGSRSELENQKRLRERELAQKPQGTDGETEARREEETALGHTAPR